MDGKEKALGLEHLSTLTTVLSLKTLYSDQGKWREAENICVWALAEYEKALGPKHTLTLTTLTTLGNLYQDQGKLKEAENMYVQAFADFEKALGPKHISVKVQASKL